MYIFLVSFRGQNKLGLRPDWSPLGVNSKFPNSIPTPFISGVPPGMKPRYNEDIAKTAAIFIARGSLNVPNIRVRLQRKQLQA